MKYRIYYRQSAQSREAVVEANSPTEAVVKFKHLRPAPPGDRSHRPEITSVSPEASFGWS